MSKIMNTKTLTTCAMLMALAVVLGFFKIPLTQMIEIRFGSFPIAIGGYLFGPVAGAVIGGVSDILGFMAKPTGPYFPGFTISAVLSGIIFGITLKHHDGKITLKQIILAEVLHTVLIGILFNSINLYILYGASNEMKGIAGIMAVIASRLAKELVMLPVNIILMTMILKPVGYIETHFFQRAER